MINGGPVNKPTLKNLIDDSRTKIFQELNCLKVGSIVSFDSVVRTAVVQIHFKRSLSIPLKDGTKVLDYPLLYDCPVVTMQGGGSAIGFPITAGDECLVLFSDANIDAWYEQGASDSTGKPLMALPLDGRRHDLSDGIALVGLNSLGKPLDVALADDEAGVADSKAKVSVKSGKINISNDTQSLLTALDTFLTGLTADNLPAQAAALKISIDALFY